MFTMDGAFDEGGPLKGKRFALNNAENARKSMAKLVKMRAAGEIGDKDYRALIWGVSQLLGYFRLEADLRIEERIEALEARLS